ncbi:TraC family protein [Paenibacillus alvei]|uniref:TraG/VirB4 family ATPase n=1 Tax=Paenibacillus alvei TaxID=44250 RepID=UPI0013D98691|nr:TraC family protein [Paenibacillus alvei]NEZ44435.1 TraC family protein [Paenibacillus alvei]
MGALKIRIPQRSRKKTPTQALPFKEFDEYLRMEDGTFRAMLKVTPINNDLLADDENDDIVELMQEAINAIHSGLIQFTVSSERLNLDEYQEYLEKKYRETNEGYFLERIDAMQKYVKRTSNRQRTAKTFYFTIASKSNDATRARDDFEEAARKIEDALSSAEIYVRLMKKHEGLRMLYEKLNPKTSLSQPYRPDMDTIASIAPVPIIHEEDYSIMDGMYYRFFTITDYPQKVFPLWMTRIFNVNAQVDTSIICVPTGKKKVIDEIDKSIGFVRWRKDKPGTKASEVNELEDKEESNLELIRQLSSDNENMFNVSMIISVKDKSLKELDISCERVLTAISTSKMSSRQLILLNNEPFWMALPIAYNSQYLANENMHWPMQSSAIASILPFNSADFMMKKGVIKGKNPATNSLVIVDRRDRRRVDNPNEVVIAPSGRGKSWYAQADISRENSLGTKCIVIDPEREYKFKFGERVVFSMGSPFCTNPFHIRSAILDLDDELEEDHNDRNNYIENVGMYLQRKIADLIPYFRYIYPKMDSTEEAELTEAIRITYEQYSGLSFDSTELPHDNVFPILTNLDEVISRDEFSESLSTFKKNLRPYVTGIYKNMFNGQTNWSMDSMLTVLDIHSLSEIIQPQMMYLLLQDIWEYMKIDRNEMKGLYVDEAWKLASPDNPQTLKFLFEMAKRIRKYGGYLTTITQNVGDFFGAGTGSRNYGQAIFDNAFFKLFLGLSENDYKTLKNTEFTFSRKEERILKRRKSKGRGIYMVGSTRVELQSTPLVDELQFIDPKEYAQVKKYDAELEYAEASNVSA